MTDEHPGWERLLDLGEGRLDEADARPVLDHVASCAPCRAQLDEYQAFRADLAAGDAGDAPEAWIRRAQTRAGSRQPPVLVPRITFDSMVDALVGMRSGTEAGRQYVIEAGDVELEVSVSPVADAEPWPVSGQLLTNDPSRALELDVMLVEDGRATETVRASDHGEFQFTRRPGGSFRIRLAGPSLDVETPDLST
jgi:hypothetical protein